MTQKDQNKTMSTPAKIDLAKLHKEEYSQPKKPVLIDVKPAVYLAVDGQGEPGGDAFSERIGALYAMAFTIKMTRKFAGQQDYAVSKLEAQWWVDGDQENFAMTPKSKWKWKLLIRTPEFVGTDEMNKAVALLRKRGKKEPVHLVRLEKIEEGRCVQMLHVGPYEEEPRTIEVMRSFVERQGLMLHGRHHEIYISDPRRVEPAKLKTVLRHPVRMR